MTEYESEFLEIFRDEATERLDAIVDTLLAVESGRPEADAVDSLFRDAHTIKGAAGMLARDEIRDLAHAVEDVLDVVREAGGGLPGQLVDPLLRAADALRAHVEGRGGPVTPLIDELTALKWDAARGGAPADAAGGPLPTPALERRMIRVPSDKLDELLDVVGETVLHRRRLEYALGSERLADLPEISDELDVGERLLSELRDAAIQMRTLPLASITGPFPRAVRDLAAAEGKDVELTVTGAETELDRVILEGLSEPLVHLLRNAVGHGIEPPDERRAAGKPSRGHVTLHAEQRGRLVRITVADDGRGVPERALEAAAEEGSLVDVLTRPGFSTAREVTELAGRGVGLDAVKAHVEALGGSLEISSTPGEGTETVLVLPLTLALLDVLLVECGESVLGIPLGNVEEAVAVGPEQPAALVRGREVEVQDLPAALSAAADPPPRVAPAVVVSAAGRRRALVCDRLVGQEEVVVKPLGPLLAGLPGYLGAAILADGRIALLLDVAWLLRRGRRAAAGAAPAGARVLVVEDSATARELQRNILAAAGYDVETAADGSEALDKIRADRGFDVVVTDVEMPEMDGFELLRALRDDPEYASLPVVVVTTRSGPEDRRRGFEAGADAYMTKRGFDQAELLETVAQLISR